MTDEADRAHEGASPPRRFNAGIAIAALLICLASPGLVVGLLTRLNLFRGPTANAILYVFYYPWGWLAERVKVIEDFYWWCIGLFGS